MSEGGLRRRRRRRRRIEWSLRESNLFRPNLAAGGGAGERPKLQYTLAVTECVYRGENRGFARVEWLTLLFVQ